MTHPIVVIGGGPAGSTVATLLAQRNFQVRLFEKEVFPRAHIGESLLPATLAVLEHSGALPAVEAEGFTTKPGATMVWGKNSEPWSWHFRETNRRFPTSLQVERPRFDQILLEHCASSGVDVHQRSHVQDISITDDDCGVFCNGEFIPAEFIIDATGQRTLLGNKLGTKVWDEDFRNMAIYSYFRGGEHLAGEDAGNILVESVRNGWIWKIPLRDEISSVGVVVDRDTAVARIRNVGVLDWYREQLRSSLLASELLLTANQIEACTVIRDWSYHHDQLASDRYCLVGDAACFIDPLFSTGVHLAVSGAYIAAAFVATLLKSDIPSTELTQSYDALYRQQYDHFRELTKLFYSGNQSVDSYFWQARRLTGQQNYKPRQAFMRSVSGQNAAGYERSVLQHANLPRSFSKELDVIEDKRHMAREIFHSDFKNTKLVLASDVSVQRKVVLGEHEFEYGYVVAGRDRTDLPISEFVHAVIGEFDGGSSVDEAVQRLGGKFRGLGENIDELVISAAQLLLQDGVLL